MVSKVLNCSSKKKDKFRKDYGASAVEFALTLPLLMLLIFGLIDFGRLFFVQISLEATSREVVRASATYLETEHCVPANLSMSDTAHPDCGLMEYSQVIQTDLRNYANSAAVEIANIATLGEKKTIDVTMINICSPTNSKFDTKIKVSVNFKWLTPISFGRLNNFTASSTGFMRCSG